jgi:thiol:disulfide interchange protein DsbA
VNYKRTLGLVLEGRVMRNLIKATLFLIVSSVSFVSLAMPLAYVEDVHYKKTEQLLATQSADKIEVVEMFFYGCPHCFNLESSVEEWKKDLPDNVSFRYVPAVFKDSWAPLAKAYYAMEKMDLLDKLHGPLFEAIHFEQRKIYTEETIADFVVEHGVDRDEFLSAMNSFAVKTAVNKAKKLTEASGISGVPALIVNGKYMTGAALAGGEEEIFNVVDFLIEGEQK